MNNLKYTRHGRLTDKDYVLIKEYVSRGYSNKDIRNLSGWGNTCIARVKRTNSFEEYKAEVNDISKRLLEYKKRGNQLQLPNTDVDTSSTSDNQSLEEGLLNIDRLLTEIKEEISKVIELGVKIGIEKEMKKVAVELKELRMLKDQAITSNWVSNLKNKLGR